MPRYLYSYLCLTGVIGFTPQQPGSDFGMTVWIDADDEEQAKAWGKRVLEEYVVQRYRPATFTPNPMHFEGESVTNPDLLRWHGYDESRHCQIGEVPNWVEAWKNDRAKGKPRKVNEK